MEKKSNPLYQAQAILARRAHSQAEIEQKLVRKGFTRAQIAKVVKTLQEQKLIDDKNFARAYVENILLAKLVGPRYLRAKLQQKRIKEEIIEEVISKAFLPLTKGESPSEARGGGGRSEEVLIQEAIRRWKKSHPQHAADRQRLFRHLASRGFSMDMISMFL